jgi:methylmalonyl-CoA mutase N-terminal domain/subunit
MDKVVDALEFAGERARRISLHGRRLPLQAHREDPTRMFAGEGGPERTNKRFHYVSLGMPAKRLSARPSIR